MVLDPSYTDPPREDHRVGVRVVGAPEGEQQAWLTLEAVARSYAVTWPAASVTGEGVDYYRALMNVQDQLDERGVRLVCCGTCQNLRMTGMSQQMSQGRVGYCMLETRRKGHMTRDKVSVFGWCEAFVFGSQAFIRNLDSLEAHRQRLSGEGEQ